MKKIEFKTQVLPHLIAILVFLLVTVIYFRPVFLQSKSLNQHDIKQWEGGAKEVLDYRAQTGKEALWTDGMFGGMPAYLISTHWGYGIMDGFTKVISLGLPHPTKVIFIAFLSFYILLLSFGVRPYIAIAGALAFGLSSYNIIGFTAGHNARIAAVAYMPLVLAGIQTTFKRSTLLGLTLTFLGLALELHAGHLQITYYLIFIVLGYMIASLVENIKSNTLKPFLIKSSLLTGVAVLALGTFLGSFLSTMEYSKYSIRGASELEQEDQESKGGLTKAYAFQYSNGIYEPMVLMIPDILGGSMSTQLAIDSNVGQFMLSNGVPAAQAEQQLRAMPTYWGNQPATSPYYAGAFVSLLCVIGLIVLPRSTIIWVSAVAIFGIMLSWGDSFSAFNYFMFDHLPGYNKFRSVTFSMILPIFCMIFMGFLGLEQILRNGWSKKTQKQLLIAFGITGGLSLLLVLAAGMFNYEGLIDARLPEWLVEPLRADRKALLINDAMRTFGIMFLGVTAIVLWMRQVFKPGFAQFLIILIVLLDMWVVDKRYLNEDDFVRNPRRAFFSPTAADNAILRDTDKSYRVLELSNPFNEARTSYYHKSIGGYHGAKIRRYQDLISNCISNEHASIIAELTAGSTSLPALPVLNMLNTKYVVAGIEENAVLRNYQANGAAWFVNSVQLVDNPDEELNALCSSDTKQIAIIDQSKFTLSKADNLASGIIDLVDYKPNHLTYKSNTDGPGLAIFSEVYYPKGWIAKIDGKEIDHIRANYILRGLEIPAGEHTVEFIFEPSIYKIGNAVTKASTILLLLMIIGTFLVEFDIVKLKKVD